MDDEAHQHHQQQQDDDLNLNFEKMTEAQMKAWAETKNPELINTARDVKGLTLLVAASKKDFVALATLLIKEMGADVHCTTKFDEMPIHRCNSLEMLSVLIEAGADILASGTSCRTPLCEYVSWFGSPDYVQRFLQLPGVKETIDRQAGRLKDTALIAACTGFASSPDRALVVEMLLNAGANPTLRDSCNETALENLRFTQPDNRTAIRLLENAEAAPERTFLLVKARSINDAEYAVTKAKADAEERGLTQEEKEENVMAANPAYLKTRMENAEGPLPLVDLKHSRGREEEDDETLTAALNYVLCLGEHKESGGMLREIFLGEFMDMIAPVWDEIRTCIPVEMK